MKLAIAAIVAVLGGTVLAEPTDAPPATLVSGKPATGAALDPVFAHLKLTRMSCAFSEAKHVALLARPLTAAGTIVFDRERGIARATLTPKPQTAVLTKTSLRIQKGTVIEEIPLDKSKDLKAFALIFPTLLRGDRAELERTFELSLYGSERDWWAVSFTPKAESLRQLVRGVVVFGRKADVVALQITEASGDTTDTRLTQVRKDGDVPDAEVAKAFGAP